MLSDSLSASHLREVKLSPATQEEIPVGFLHIPKVTNEGGKVDGGHAIVEELLMTSAFNSVSLTEGPRSTIIIQDPDDQFIVKSIVSALKQSNISHLFHSFINNLHHVALGYRLICFWHNVN